MRRTTDGQTEAQTLTLAVVGLLSVAAEHKVYVPIALAEALDQWCAHQTDQLAAPGGQPELPRLTCDRIRAYGPEEHGGRAALEARALQADVQPGARFTAVEPAGTHWLAVRQGVPAAKWKALLAGVECRMHPVRVLTVTAGRVAGLAADDPRWEGKRPAAGQVLARAAGPTCLEVGDGAGDRREGGGRRAG